MYELRFTKTAEKYFKKLKEKGLKSAYAEALSRIAANPYIGDYKTGDLAGVYGLDVYYNRTNYEIAYRIYEEDGNVVAVIMAGTREIFYKELKKYMRP